jgi:WD40 repeat protein
VQSIAAVDASDGRRRLLVAVADGRVHRLDPVTGDVAAPAVYPHAARPNSLDVVPVGREQIILAVGTRGYLRCFDAHTGQRTGITPEPEVHWYGLAIADLPDGRTLLVGGHDDGITRMLAPDLAPCEPHADENAMTIWDVATIALPDGRVVVAGAGHDWLLYRWDAATGQSLGAPSPGHQISIKAIAAAVIGGVPTLFTGCEAGQVRRWDAATGAPIGNPLPSELDQLSGLTVVRTSPGQQLLVGIDLDGRVHYWDAVTGQLQWTSGELSPFTPPLPSPHLLHSYHDRDGRTILVFLNTHDDQLGRWDVEARSVLQQPLPSDAHAIFNDRESIMLVRCTADGTLVIEELA